MLQVVNLEALVPPDHVLRQIDQAVDLSFVRPRVANLYHANLGRPSIPPELVVRMFLLSYLYNLSDVRLCDEVAMHAGYRWFCRLNFDDPVPDRTTLVKLRQKWGRAGVFEALMNEVVRQCVEAGLVRGTEVGVDGTMVTANAATNSLAALAPVESLPTTCSGFARRTSRNRLQTVTRMVRMVTAGRQAAPVPFRNRAVAPGIPTSTASGSQTRRIAPVRTGTPACTGRAGPRKPSSDIWSTIWPTCIRA